MIKVKILSEELYLKNEMIKIDELFAKINKILEDQGFVFECMIIDEAEVYENHYEYIAGKLKDIREIFIKISTIREIIQGSIDLIIQRLERIIPEIEPLVLDFYLGAKQGDSIDRLGTIMENLQWFVSIFNNIEENNVGYEELRSNTAWGDCISYVLELLKCFNALKEAIKNMDKVLIADILKYEVEDILTSLYNRLNELTAIYKIEV